MLELSAPEDERGLMTRLLSVISGTVLIVLGFATALLELVGAYGLGTTLAEVIGILLFACPLVLIGGWLLLRPGRRSR